MLTVEQIAELNSLVSQQRYNDGYRYLLEASSVKDGAGNLKPAPGVDRNSWVWLAGATDVNAGTGAANDFIRTYTKKQMEIRSGETVSDAKLQEISDEIAKAVLNDAIVSGALPSIIKIATDDASKTVAGIPGADAAVWSGNALFLALGQDKPFKDTLLEQPGDTYDLLTAIKCGIEAAGPVKTWGQQIDLMLKSASQNTLDIGGTSRLFGSVILEANAFLKAAYGGIAPLLGALTTERIFIGRLNEASTIEGSSSGDYQIGGNKDDVLRSSAGNDIMDGRKGNDTADYSNSENAINVTVKDAAGTSKFTAGVTGYGIDALYNIETIVGSKFDDKFILKTIHDWKMTLDGGDGADVLSSFYLDGNSQFDAVSGTLTTSKGSVGFKNFEKFEGGSGNDTFVASDDLVEVNGRDGQDTLDFSKLTHGVGETLPFTIKNIERVIGSQFDDTITGDRFIQQIDGGGGNDLIRGGVGDNILFGGDGADELYGGAGNDYLYGGADDDKLFGGEDIDILSGGLGNDQLTGGAEADVFVFGDKDMLGGTGLFLGNDFVADFRYSQGDKLDFSAFGSLNLEETSWQQGGIKTDAGHQIVFNQSNTGSGYFARVMGAEGQDFGTIFLQGTTGPLNADWFIFA